MRQRQRLWVVALGLGILVLLSGVNGQAQSLEERVRKLEEQRAGATSRLPSWVNKLKLSGDLRLRYQFDDANDRESRHRGRFRYRLLVVAEIVENLKVGFGLASGGDDPRSTNETLDDNFSSKGIRIDLVYAEYEPVPGVTLLGGKFKNPIWRPSDLLWDSDIRPEGGALRLEHKARPDVTLFLMSGVFIVDEDIGGADPLLIPVQGGGTFTLAKQVQIKMAVTYYEFVDVQGMTLDFSEGSNSTLAGGGLRFDFDAVSVGVEVALVKLPSAYVPYIAVFGEYVHNLDPDDDNQGFLGGIKVGHQSVQKAHQWQARYLYRRLERDAWPDIFPDAGFFGGATSAKGHEIIVVYGVATNVSVGLDYYHTEAIDGPIEEDVFQFDVMLAF